MDLLAAEQPSTPTGDHPGMPDRAERHCGLFGCLHAAAGMLTDPRRSAASLPGVTTEPKWRAHGSPEDGPR